MLELLTALERHATAANSGTLALAAAAVIGLLVGSFLNVVIHRLPAMMQREADNYLAQETGQPLPHQQRYDFIRPRSACPHCTTTLAGIHNVPLLSYLLLRGRCAYCQAPISRRYPAVELTSALLSVILIQHFGFSQTGLAALVLLYFLIALSFIDADTQLLPDSLTLPLLWLGLLVNLQGLFVPLSDAVTGAMSGYLFLWAIYWAFRLITGKEGIGYGDFKLMAALGAWLGWQLLPLILLLASCFGAIAGVSLVLLKKRRSNQSLPFGPYLALAGILALLTGSSWLSFFHVGPI
jgi:leader peptidase (prepilin peptidase) / N-methyltransferase